MTHQNPELGEFKGFALQLKRFYANGQVNDRLSFSLERLPDLEGPLEEALEAIDRLRQAMPAQPQKEDSDPPQGMRIGIIAGSGAEGLFELLAIYEALDDGSTPSPGSEEKEDSHPPASGDAPPSWDDVLGHS